MYHCRKMTSHYRSLTVAQMNQASRQLANFTIPKVNSTKEGEANTKRMSKTYLPKIMPKPKTLDERKGIPRGTLIDGSKHQNINRMSKKERAHWYPGGYNT